MAIIIMTLVIIKIFLFFQFCNLLQDHPQENFVLF